ncbi:hypothetical protein ABW19_dt0204337 [Dactylella cylindrospora]|nr:hypothetical protein ABW19_dt0204337 [Dactylella cylindrospora]
MSFDQSGQVDWVSLASKAVSIPISVMSRLALAGVDVYTLEVAKHFGTTLTLPDSYTSKIEHQLVQSPKFFLRNDVLWAGLGVSTVPRELAKTSGGVSMAALTVALRNSFSKRYSAKVLRELVKASCPEHVRKTFVIPSVSQFEALSDEIVAVAADTDFHDQIEALRTSMPKTLPSASKLFPDPLELAYVIKGLVSCENLNYETPTMQIIVCPSVSPLWIATFAARVMGFRAIFESDQHIILDTVNTPLFPNSSSTATILHLVCEGSEGFVKQSCQDTQLMIPGHITTKLSLSENLQVDDFRKTSIPQFLAAKFSRLNSLQLNYVIAVAAAYLEVISQQDIVIRDWPLARRGRLNRSGIKISDLISEEAASETFNSCIGALTQTKVTLNFGHCWGTTVQGQAGPAVGEIGIEGQIALYLVTALPATPDGEYLRKAHTKVVSNFANPLATLILSLFFVEFSAPLESIYLNKNSIQEMLWLRHTRDDGFYISYDVDFSAILRNIWVLLREPDSVMSRSMGIDASTRLGRVETLGVSTGGLYALVPAAIDPNLTIVQNLRLRVGKGALFLDGKVAHTILSSRHNVAWYLNSRLGPGNKNMSISESEFGQTLCKYNPTLVPWSEDNYELQGAKHYAWVCTVRDGVDLIAQIILSPMNLIIADPMAGTRSSGKICSKSVLYDQVAALKVRDSSANLNSKAERILTRLECNSPGHACLALLNFAVAESHNVMFSKQGESFEEFRKRVEATNLDSPGEIGERLGVLGIYCEKARSFGPTGNSYPD